jgi:hypothetical protein
MNMDITQLMKLSDDLEREHDERLDFFANQERILLEMRARRNIPPPAPPQYKNIPVDDNQPVESFSEVEPQEHYEILDTELDDVNSEPKINITPDIEPEIKPDTTTEIKEEPEKKEPDIFAEIDRKTAMIY